MSLQGNAIDYYKCHGALEYFVIIFIAFTIKIDNIIQLFIFWTYILLKCDTLAVFYQKFL